MDLGKALFAQAMDFLPWKTFHRIVNRYGGDHRTRSLSCADQFRVMAFAQLTYRESLRDIEVCLAAQAGKLYHIGISAAVARSTLADANEARDWRIYFELAQRLITKARALYVDEDFGVELANTVYALDATTIDLCLSMFPWVPFRSTKAAVKLHTLLDLRGSIPTFIHISDGKMHDVNVLDLLLIEAGAFYIMDRGYLDFERLYALDQAGGFFITRAKRNLDARRVYSAPVDRDTGLICDQTIALNGFYAAKHYPAYLRRIRYRDAVQEAAKNGFKMDHLIGVWWSGGDQDARPAGAAGKGYSTLDINGVGQNYSAIQDILKYVVDKGKSQTPKDQVGEYLYNRAVMNAVLIAEGIRTAQKLTGKKRIDGADMRRGLETLNLTEARCKELGLPGFAEPIHLSCTDHNGQGLAASDHKLFQNCANRRELERKRSSALAGARRHRNPLWLTWVRR